MAITYSRVQSKSADADPGAVTLDLTPIEGNLLVVHATERSGGSAASFAIDGTGWTKQIAETTLPADNQARRTHVVFWKVAGAAEPKLVSVDDGTVEPKRVLVEEYQTGAAVTWSFEAAVAANTGTGSTSPLASGSTASTSGTQLLVGSAVWRNGTGDPGTIAFSGLGTVVSALGGNNGRTAAVAFAQDATTGTKSTSLSWTGSGHEANVALLVFSATEGGGGVTGSAASVAPAGQATGAGTVAASGSGAAVAPAGLAAGSGSVAASGAATSTAAAGQASSVGAVTVTGSSAAVAPAGIASGAGTVGESGRTGAATSVAPAAVAAGSGTVAVVGSGAATVPAGVATGAGQVAIAGAGASVAPAGVAAGTAVHGAVVLTGTAGPAAPRVPTATAAQPRSPSATAAVPAVPTAGGAP